MQYRQQTAKYPYGEVAETGAGAREDEDSRVSH